MKGKGEGMNHQSYRDRFDTVGRSVRFCVGTELPGDSKVDVPNGVVAGVFGPQAGEPLAHRTDCVRYRLRCNGVTAWCDTAVAVAGTEDLEVGDRILGMAKEGVKGEGGTIRDPECPMRILFLGVCISDSGGDRLLDNAKIRLEYIGCRRGQSRHGSGCGTFELK